MKKSILVILGVFVLVKVMLLFKPLAVGWDESVYISMGKYIYSIGEIGLFEVIRPPVLPIFFGSGWFFGFDAIMSARVIEAVFSAGCVFLVYLIGSKVFDERVGVLSALIIAVTPIFFEYSSRVLSSIPSVFFMLLGLFFILEKRWFWCGIFFTISFLTRYPMGLGLVFLGMYFVFFERKIRSAARCFSGVFAALLPFFVFNVVLYSKNGIYSVVYPIIMAMGHQGNPLHAVGGFWANLFFYFKEMFFDNWILVFFIYGLLWVIRSRKREHSIFLPGGMLFLYYTIIVNKQYRFALGFLPFVCLLAGYGIIVMYERVRDTSIRKTVFGFLVGICFMGALVGSYGVYDEWPDSIESEERFVEMIRGLDGVILTTIPIPGAYIDKKFLKSYDNFDYLVRDYIRLREDIDYFIYVPNLLGCFDDECAKRKEMFERVMFNEGEVIAETDLYETPVFVVKMRGEVQ